MNSSSEPCLLCGTVPMVPVRPYRAESPAGRTLFGNANLERCTSCDFVQMAPQPTRERLEHYYADAYRQDPKFFEFTRSMEAYKKTFNGHSTLILTPDSEFFKYLKQR